MLCRCQVDRVGQLQPFLERLTVEDREQLNGLMAVRRFGHDEIVVTQHDAGADVFMVLEGAARATIFSRDGKMVAYRDVNRGDIFGELAAIDGDRRSASVVAVDDLTVGTLSGPRFRSLIDSNASFRWALLEHLSQQARTMTERIFEFSTMLVRERLIHELFRFASVAGVEEGAFEIDPAPTHFELAARISTHREAVSREMSRLAKQGLLSKVSGRLILHDVALLRRDESDED